MRRFLLVAALAAAGLPVSCGFAGQRPEGFEKRDYHSDPSLKFRPAPLSEIVRNPQRGLEVEFTAMLNRRDESVWQAYYTPFKPGEFKSFSVWPADAAVWDVRGRGRSIPTLYISGDSPEIAELYAMDRYTPIRIRGVVESNFDSRPWIRVHYVEEIDSPWFTDDSLGSLIRGLDAAKANAANAMGLLDNSLSGPLSPAGEAAAYKAQGWIHLGKKNYREAESAYARALDSSPGDRQAMDGLERARRKAAAGPWTDEPASKDDPPPTANWKEMYTGLLTEHETTCKKVMDDHAKCAEMTQALTAERDAAVKAHSECGAGAEGMKKQVEEKDAALKATSEKLATVEGERDAAVKAHADCGAGAEGVKKQLEEKDAALKAATEKVTALETERDELKKKVEAGGTDAEATKKAMEEKDAAIKAANEKVTALETERDELKKKIAEGGGGGDEATKKQLEADKAKIAELEQQVKDRDESIKKQREEIDRLTEELKKKEGGN
ncbi:MAG TPA: hypothetical protein VFS19_05015 [Planctomycetota bacterium]|nr:hypothetical protein [Planctomycetota bacterium]